MAFQQRNSGLLFFPESPQLPAKRMCSEADSTHISMGTGMEMRKLVVSTCRNITYVDTGQTAKEITDTGGAHISRYRPEGFVAIPTKKALFEDEQSKDDEILHMACQSLLQHRIHETSRKIRETRSKKRAKDALNLWFSK